jgi:hypothetical protein
VAKAAIKCLCLARVFALYMLDVAHDAKSVDEHAWGNGIRVLKISIKCAKTCAGNGELSWAVKTLEKAARYCAELADVQVSKAEKEVLERLRNEFLVMRVLLVGL